MVLRRKKDGMTIIQENVDKFQNIIDGLDKGICLCEDEESNIEKEIEVLAGKSMLIEKSQKQATSFRDKLNDMLSVPDEEENKED